MAMTLLRPALISVTAPGGSAQNLSDHNRQPLEMSYEQIEKSQRTANGTLRKYVVASKRTFSTSWQDLPSVSSTTVDGYLGALALKSFYDSNYDNSITLKVYAGSSTAPTEYVSQTRVETISTTVFISSFSASISRRLGGIDFWNVDISFVEV